MRGGLHHGVFLGVGRLVLFVNDVELLHFGYRRYLENRDTAAVLQGSKEREVAFTERWKLQFRTESFNLFNTPIFNTPGMNVADSVLLKGNGNFGRITSSVTGAERRLQFALRLSF